MRISDWSSDVCSSDLAEHDGRCAICVVLVAIAGLSADTDTDAAPACAECDRCIQCGCCKSLHVAGRDARCRVLSPGWCARQHQCARNQNCLIRSEEHTSELQSLIRISYAVFCLTQKHK